MASFTIKTPTLAAAAVRISTASASGAGEANSVAQSLAGYSGAFGGEEFGAAFLAMASRGLQATGELQTVLESLSRNVAAASVGYLVTDRGIVPTSSMLGFKP